MNVPLYQACGKTVPGYSVNVIGRKILIYATADQKNRKSSQFSCELKIQGETEKS